MEKGKSRKARDEALRELSENVRLLRSVPKESRGRMYAARRCGCVIASVLSWTIYATVIACLVWTVGTCIIPQLFGMVLLDIQVGAETSPVMVLLVVGFPFLFLTIMIAVGTTAAIRWSYRHFNAFVLKFKARVLPEHVKEGV